MYKSVQLPMPSSDLVLFLQLTMRSEFTARPLVPETMKPGIVVQVVMENGERPMRRDAVDDASGGAGQADCSASGSRGCGRECRQQAWRHDGGATGQRRRPRRAGVQAGGGGSQRR